MVDLVYVGRALVYISLVFSILSAVSYLRLFAAAVEAKKHTNDRVVTVAMKEVVFKEPVMVGELVSFYTYTTKIGRTSIAVHVNVEVDRKGDQCLPDVVASPEHVKRKQADERRERQQGDARHPEDQAPYPACHATEPRRLL